MRYTITLSYDGSGFCGWQVQPGAETIQGCLENALSTLLRTDIPVCGAGRTDTGVNAAGYVCHFDCDIPFDARQLRYKLNAITPATIVIHEIAATDGDFHARFLATKREYTYFLNTKKDPFVRKFSYLYTFPLDFELMNKAAEALIGRHDFSCFEKTGGDNRTSICTVNEACWHQYTPDHVALMGYPEDGEYWYFRISADRFLRNMVRAVVGSLLEVGRGKRTPDSLAALVLPAGSGTAADGRPSRSDAGESVPGHALFLSKIDY